MDMKKAHRQTESATFMGEKRTYLIVAAALIVSVLGTLALQVWEDQKVESEIERRAANSANIKGRSQP